MTAICFFFSLVWFYLLGVGGGGKSRASLGVQAVNTESVYLSCVRCCSFGFSKTQNGPGDGSPASGMTGALQVESQKKRSLFSVGFHAEAAPNWALLGRRGLAGSLRTHGGHILWECDFKKTRAAIQRETFVVPNLTHTVRRENSKKAFFFSPRFILKGARRKKDHAGASRASSLTCDCWQTDDPTTRQSLPKWQRRCRTMRDWQMNNETSRCTSGAFVHPLKIYWYWWCLYQWCDPDFLQRWY